MRIKIEKSTEQILRSLSVKKGTRDGSIDYYFNDKNEEIGFIAFPGTSNQKIMSVEGRRWSPEFLEKLKYTVF